MNLLHWFTRMELNRAGKQQDFEPSRLVAMAKEVFCTDDKGLENLVFFQFVVEQIPNIAQEECRLPLGAVITAEKPLLTVFLRFIKIIFLRIVRLEKTSSKFNSPGKSSR